MTKTPEVVDICPECKAVGRLNPFWPSDSNKWHFVMVHEGLGYDWGTSIKDSERVEARRRCYLTKAPHRQWAMQRLGLSDDEQQTVLF